MDAVEELYVVSVTDFSSYFNQRGYIFYSPDNVIGKPCEISPTSDPANLFLLRNYGTWWKKHDASVKKYTSQNNDVGDADDYITLMYHHLLFVKSIRIYEFNPGFVVRIWGGYQTQAETSSRQSDRKYLQPVTWVLLREGVPTRCAQHTAALELQLKNVKKPINFIRLEFNVSLLDYYAGLGAVALTGYPVTWEEEEDSEEEKEEAVTLNELSICLDSSTDSDTSLSQPYMTQLPREVLLHIFQYLNLKSLCRCGQVCRLFNEISNSPTLYRELCFKKYWNQINNDVLKSFLPKCVTLKKLNFSWCGDVTNMHVTAMGFNYFLKNIPQEHLTHLIFDCCAFLDCTNITMISCFRNLKELRLRNLRLDSQYEFVQLSDLELLETIDFTGSTIYTYDLNVILASNSNLKHLIVDLCPYLQMNVIVDQLVNTNQQLRTLSCWKTCLSSNRLSQISQLTELRELDLGWCLQYQPQDSFSEILSNCPHLKLLILSGFCGLTDNDLLDLLNYCPNLTYLDIQAVIDLTFETCQLILNSKQSLKFLDIAYCKRITNDMYRQLRGLFPGVDIKFAETYDPPGIALF